jgi:drug/metabolite transporter (DMT)-like permease
MRPKTLSLIQVNSAVFLWGLTTMFPKWLQLTPITLVFFRSLASAIVLVIFLKSTGSRIDIKRREDYPLMGLLGVILCVHWVTLFTALQMAKAAVVIIALNTYPALTTLVEPLFYRKRPKRIDVGLAIAVFAGVYILLPELAWNRTTVAIGLAVLSGSLFALRNIIIRKHANHYGGSTLMLWQTLPTCILLLPLTFIFPERVSDTELGVLAMLGVVFTALPQSLYAAGLKHLTAKTVGILSLMQVFWGGMWGYFLFKEHITIRTVIGGSIILACVAFEVLRNTQAPKPLSIEHD